MMDLVFCLYLWADSRNAALSWRCTYLGTYSRMCVVEIRGWVVLGEDLSCAALTSEILADSWFNPDMSLLTGFERDRAVPL